MDGPLQPELACIPLALLTSCSLLTVVDQAITQANEWMGPTYEVVATQGALPLLKDLSEWKGGSVQHDVVRVPAHHGLCSTGAALLYSR
jgi:hypothetical protein